MPVSEMQQPVPRVFILTSVAGVLGAVTLAYLLRAMVVNWPGIPEHESRKVGRDVHTSAMCFQRC